MARRRRGQFPEPKKERGQWRIRYYADVAQPDGSIQRKRKTKCLGRVDEMTHTEARKEALKFLQPINDVEPGLEHKEKTINDLIRQWRLAVKPNLKRSTQHSYEWAFQRIQGTFGIWPLTEIEKSDVQEFLTGASNNLAPESVHDLRARLRGLMTLSAEWGWTPDGTNPASGRLRLPPRAPTRERHIPIPLDFRRHVEALPQPYKAIVALAGLGGLRRGELSALRRNDVLDSKIRVDEAVYRGVLGTAKFAKSIRVVDVPTKVCELIQEWSDQCKFKEPEDFLFSIRTNSPIDLNSAIERVIKPIAREIGVPPYGWHDFRRAYVTWGRQAGVEAEIMRDQVGHSSVALTQDVYSQLNDRSGAAEKIGNYVWPEPERHLRTVA